MNLLGIKSCKFAIFVVLALLVISISSHTIRRSIVQKRLHSVPKECSRKSQSTWWPRVSSVWHGHAPLSLCREQGSICKTCLTKVFGKFALESPSTCWMAFGCVEIDESLIERSHLGSLYGLFGACIVPMDEGLFKHQVQERVLSSHLWAGKVLTKCQWCSHLCEALTRSLCHLLHAASRTPREKTTNTEFRSLAWWSWYEKSIQQYGLHGKAGTGTCKSVWWWALFSKIGFTSIIRQSHEIETIIRVQERVTIISGVQSTVPHFHWMQLHNTSYIASWEAMMAIRESVHLITKVQWLIDSTWLECLDAQQHSSVSYSSTFAGVVWRHWPIK